MKYAKGMFLAFLRDEVDGAGCGVLCGVELFIAEQHQGEVFQTPRLTFCVVDPFIDFQSFLCLLYPFLVKT